MKRPMKSLCLICLVIMVASCGTSTGGPDTAIQDTLTDDPGIDLVIAYDTGSDESDGRDIVSDIVEIEDFDTVEVDTGIEPGYFGYPCTDNRECFVSFCVQSAEGNICTKNCYEEGDCPESWKCRSVAGAGGDPIYICLPSGIWLCKPCETNDACSSTINVSNDRCVVYGSAGNYCGVSCGQKDDPECPGGFSCQEVSIVGGGTAFQCVPDNQECTCSEAAITAGASTACFVSNPSGVCRGRRECVDGGLTPCDARTPAAETCNGFDDNCDGTTDEEGSEGCRPYYIDNDQDGWGIGLAHCLCGDPGPSYTTKPGDCNDSSLGMNPSVREVCNGMDDDCNGITDEQNSFGCTDYSLDNDGDGFGQPGEKRCLCQKTPPFTGAAVGDCDDTRADICPDIGKCREKCDTVDNDCDGSTDGENAVGCTPFYFDADQDTYGLPSKFKCLCGALGLYTASRAGDCNDTDPEINSTGDEICNALDDNCNGKTDEGVDADLCPPPPGVILHGSTGCDKQCKLTSCDGATVDGIGNYVPAWYDVNGVVNDGCECQADVGEQRGGQTCNSAINLGAVPDSGFKVSSDNTRGSAIPASDVDWYTFQASDPTWNGETGNCDYYNVRIRFITNPSNQFVFDVFRGSCAGADQICSEKLNHEWAVNFISGTGSAKRGECPCSANYQANCDAPDNYQECLRVQGTPQNCNSCPGYGSPNNNVCTDNSARVYVKVFRDPLVAPTCATYELEISNGLYPFSGTIN